MSKNTSGLTVLFSLAGAFSLAAYLLYSNGKTKVVEPEKKCSL
jgi:hypothetical protein